MKKSRTEAYGWARKPDATVLRIVTGGNQQDSSAPLPQHNAKEMAQESLRHEIRA
ncbi:hypothetical protein [Pontibacter brevis]